LGVYSNTAKGVMIKTNTILSSKYVKIKKFFHESTPVMTGYDVILLL